MNKITYIALMLLALASSSAIAQSRKDSLTTKVVDVVKSYAPTIADADKKREDAKIKDSLTVKKKIINYTIYSVPVASTFVPDKGRAAENSARRLPKFVYCRRFRNAQHLLCRCESQLSSERQWACFLLAKSPFLF